MKNITKTLLIGVAIILSCFMIACGGGNKESEKNVVLDKGNGEQLEEIYVPHGETYSLGRPTRAGYTFVAWFDQKTGGSAITDNRGESNGLIWSNSAKTTVYARWVANEYIIKLDYQGATEESSTILTIEATYDQEIGTLPVPIKSGSDFAGWYTATSGGAQASGADGVPTDAYKIYKAPEFASKTGDENSTVLYARWVMAVMTINFETNDGTEISALQKNAGSIIESMPLTAKNNMTFTGWYLDANLVEKAEFPFTVSYNSAKTITLYAKYLASTTDYLTFTSINQDKEYRASLTNNSYSGSMVIPDLYFGKKVTALGSFSGGRFSSLVIAHTVSSIVSSAFENCTNLTSAVLPQGISAIPSSLFKGCTSLTDIKMPSLVTNIGDSSFANTALTSFEVSAKITSIGNGFLSGCTSLQTITVAEGNLSFLASDNVLYRNYGSYYHLVLYAPAKTDSTYAIDAKTQRILDYAFLDAVGLKTITIGGSISIIGKGAFQGCTELYKVDITLDMNAPGVNASIGEGAFYGCTKLKALTIRNTRVPALGDNAFLGVSNVFTIYVPSENQNNYKAFSKWSDFSSKIFELNDVFGDYAVMDTVGGYAIRQYLGNNEEIIIPQIINGKNIVAINEKAFAYNANLKTISLPQYINSIGSQAFAYCSALESVNLIPQAPPALASNSFEQTNNTFYIYVDTNTDVVNAYRSATNWSEFSQRIFSRSE